jgi:ketosteroid isomerase-like protein
MTNAEAITAFTNLLKAGDHAGAAKQFNAPNIVSLEAMDGPGARVEGLEALKAKWEWWESAHELHGATTEGPFINGDQFAVVFDMDVTEKATGKRSKGREIALYTMKDGKVVEEKFYYASM